MSEIWCRAVGASRWVKTRSQLTVEQYRERNPGMEFVEVLTNETVLDPVEEDA